MGFKVLPCGPIPAPQGSAHEFTKIMERVRLLCRDNGGPFPFGSTVPCFFKPVLLRKTQSRRFSKRLVQRVKAEQN